MPKITFLPDGNSIDVEPGTSILQAAKKAHAQVGFACGGVCACSTCHVYVREGFDSLSEQQENEEDILDKAFDVRSTSRLGCQSKVADEDVVVEITRESRQAWLDEHPEERAKLKQEGGSVAR
ncbi:MAG TPA: 2Fe-2S iron-sulfur cluster-binding protein [Polyangia bacterium]|nr:2Fe-2S iron-sulfur cluster-binding protein [Polyangia bacterium]